LLTFKDQSGTAKGLVIRTGDRTVIGCIAKLLSHAVTVDTPITKEISQSIYIIMSVGVFLGIFFFIIALCLGYPFIESVTLLVVIIVVNAPKGLLVTMTVNSNY
jgi:sodium/potassium-transporting ATPase subunit alpha